MSISISTRTMIPKVVLGFFLQPDSSSLEVSVMPVMKLTKAAATPLTHPRSWVSTGGFGGFPAMVSFSFAATLLFLNASDLRTSCCWDARAKAAVPSSTALSLPPLPLLLQLISSTRLRGRLSTSAVVAALELCGSLAVVTVPGRLPAATIPFRRPFSAAGAAAATTSRGGDTAAKAWVCASTDLAIPLWSAATAGSGGGGGADDGGGPSLLATAGSGGDGGADDGGGPSPRLAAGLAGGMPVSGDMVLAWADLLVMLLSSLSSSSSASASFSSSSARFSSFPSSPGKSK
mmetsp:Transcript_58378/g.148025  ORF Transcript_58378/g.148025 Transcript_58378/m.148025 type:complete len:290 (-) Transcript_58378:910-1779(-)